MKEAILLQTAREYFETADESVEKFRPNSAVILYFKALVALSDIYILRKTGKTPSSHNDRFAICRRLFPDIHQLLDKDFPFYQDSYVQIMKIELAKIVKEDVHVLEQKLNLKLK